MLEKTLHKITKQLWQSLFLTSLFSATAFAGTKHNHKGHKAHEHGKAKLTFLVEGNKITAQLESPSESIYGFEYEPKTDSDKKKREESLEKLKTTFGEMVLLDTSLGCKFENTKLKIETESGKGSGQHSETHAEFVANCSKSPAGSRVSFAFRKHFKGLKNIDVQVLSGDAQKGILVKNDKGDVTL